MDLGTSSMGRGDVWDGDAGTVSKHLLLGFRLKICETK